MIPRARVSAYDKYRLRRLNRKLLDWVLLDVESLRDSFEKNEIPDYVASPERISERFEAEIGALEASSGLILSTNDQMIIARAIVGNAPLYNINIAEGLSDHSRCRKLWMASALAVARDRWKNGDGQALSQNLVRELNAGLLVAAWNASTSGKPLLIPGARYAFATLFNAQRRLREIAESQRQFAAQVRERLAVQSLRRVRRGKRTFGECGA